MSDCLHCDIHEMLESHLQSEQADLAEIAAKVTEVLADLILMAPPDEQLRLLADVLTNLGGMVLEKAQETDPTNPRHSRH
jgi:vacuolar-type H+-ATPase subunit D/Vma8